MHMIAKLERNYRVLHIKQEPNTKRLFAMREAVNNKPTTTEPLP